MVLRLSYWSCCKRTFVYKFLHVASATCEQVPQKEGKKRTTMLMTILLTGLFSLFVLMVLAALVYTLVRLVNNAGTRDDRQQPVLKASVLHVMLRGGR